MQIANFTDHSLQIEFYLPEDFSYVVPVLAGEIGPGHPGKDFPIPAPFVRVKVGVRLLTVKDKAKLPHGTGTLRSNGISRPIGSMPARPWLGRYRTFTRARRSASMAGQP
jgi:hypothetical protein